MNNSRFVTVSWAHIREHIKQIRPKFVEIVDCLSPDSSFNLYTASYPFGTIIGDEKDFYYPQDKNKLLTITELSPNIIADLSYAKNSIPMGMVLNNSTELYIENSSVCIPIRFSAPGNFYGLLREFGHQGSFHPSGLMRLSAGARSSFLIPNIGDATKYSNLRRDYKIKKNAPKDLFDHWALLKELHDNIYFNENLWTTTLLFFSEKWVKHIKNDKAWLELKLFLIEEEWRKNLFKINQSLYEIIFSLTQSKKNLKPNPYLADTARHLLSIAVGSSVGFVPAINEIAGPYKILQSVLLDSYGLKYAPTIMHPEYFNILQPSGHNSIYHSLNHPTKMAFAPKSRQESRMIQDMRELKDITMKFLDVLKDDAAGCKNTIAYNVLNSIDINFYHSKPDVQEELLLSTELPDRDPLLCKNMVNDTNLPFADSGAFIRGCVQISKKEMVTTGQ
jgi:hypothetical protein